MLHSNVVLRKLVTGGDVRAAWVLRNALLMRDQGLNGCCIEPTLLDMTCMPGAKGQKLGKDRIEPCSVNMFQASLTAASGPCKSRVDPKNDEAEARFGMPSLHGAS